MESRFEVEFLMNFTFVEMVNLKLKASHWGNPTFVFGRSNPGVKFLLQLTVSLTGKQIVVKFRIVEPQFAFSGLPLP